LIRSVSKLRLGGPEFARYYGVAKSEPIVAAIAEGLVGGMAAAAQRNHTASRQTKRVAGRVDDLKIAFDANRTVRLGSDLGRGHPSDRSTARR